MKKIVNGLLSLLVIVAMFVLVGTLMVQSQLGQISSFIEPTFMDVETQVAHYFEPIRAMIPEPKQNEFDALQKEVVQDPKFQEISETLVTNALSDVVSGDISMNELALKGEVQSYIESYAPEIESLSEGNVSVEEVSAVVEEALNHPDVQRTYETIITRVQQELSPNQQRVLTGVHWFMNERSKIIIGTLVSIALILLTLMLMNTGWHWTKLFGKLAFITAALMLALYLISPVILDALQQRFGTEISLKQNPFRTCLWMALGNFGMSLFFKIMSRLEA
ncbi:hypothetical protein [Erysipelothrix sp. strain 2 (EsS2-6-Brazil)]|uniref:hypothetical protein n=1 Tax=Erysipelothrix sp. strain 2 (EsS2-6-Brazil) TaxID=2500549 RepID=UPI0013778306|nr:hypothetical protein [Erysipelothrix sp. strain 2 (EsS2-6-Brazil)]MBK2402414.1 hypothetical protein [Erysipelothrix sp. strain 2 (EsS2-6-Brazil)]NBA00730.1 hypothetical protein [Erysipelothrix rhusiopathiae]